MSASLELAIQRTLVYARFFDSNLTLNELHFWLISNRPVSKSRIHDSRSTISRSKPNYRRLRASQNKLILANRLTSLLRLIPSIELIAVTGSLAVDNAKRSDDIDLLIVTQPNTLWLTRLLVIPFVRLLFKSRLPKGQTLKGAQRAPAFGGEGRTLRDSDVSDAICLNLWLDTLALAVPTSKRSLYTAHEVLQVKPLFNKHRTYERFITANAWTKTHLANAWQGITGQFKGPTLKGAQRVPAPSWEGRTLKVVSFLNSLAFRLQYAYMRSKMTTETVSLHAAYFHPRSLARALDEHLKTPPADRRAHNL